MTLELADARSQAMASSSVTEYDGYFLFDKARYGACRLRVGAASAKALRIDAELRVALSLDRAHPTIRTGAVRIVGAERAQAAAGP